VNRQFGEAGLRGGSSTFAVVISSAVHSRCRHRHAHIHRRIDHKNIETANQAAEPATKASHAERGASSQMAPPKARSPKLPRAAPAASSAAASLPRRAPRSPTFSLRSRSCFSMSVALALKIAGNARNKPPVSGPNTFAIAPVATVAKPPSTKRMRYSCHRVSRSAEGCIRMFMARYPSSSHFPPSATDIQAISDAAVAASAGSSQRFINSQTAML
jgi:hypothetical protein